MIRTLLGLRSARGMGCHREQSQGGGLPDLERLSLDSVPETTSVSLEPFAGPVWQQGGTSSCVAQGICGAELTALTAQGVKAQPGSRLWLYSMTRWVLDPQLASVDAGCRGSDALWVLAERGLPPETAWPWEPRKVNSRPPLSAAWDARDRRGVRGTYAVYASNLDARIRAVRAALGAQKGVVLSIPVWAEDTEDGGSRVLTYRDVQPRGLHLVQVLDCSDMGIVRIQNSWGASWRDFGRCWLPPVYLQRSEFVAVIDPKESPK